VRVRACACARSCVRVCVSQLKAKPDGTYEPAVPTLLVKGHTADVNAIDVHPKREYLFASAALSDMVYLWDANLRSLVGQCSLKGRQGSCIAFRGDAKHLAIGCVDGCVYVFRELNDCTCTLAAAAPSARVTAAAPRVTAAALRRGAM
jgi:WD40 repeat protein